MELAQQCFLWLLCRLIFVMKQCKSCFSTMWPWPKFSRSNVMSHKSKELAQKWSLWLLRGWYSPSNSITANVVLNDLDLHFQRQTFQLAILTMIGWKMQTLLLLSNRKPGICYRMKPLRTLYIMKLIYILNVTDFIKWIFWKWWDLAKNFKEWFLQRLIFIMEWDHCGCCTLWLSPLLSRLNNFPVMRLR